MPPGSRLSPGASSGIGEATARALASAGAAVAVATRWGDKQRLTAEDVARAILYVTTQPAHVNVNELLVRPTAQET